MESPFAWLVLLAVPSILGQTWWQDGSKLIGSGGTGNVEAQGNAVAISGVGDRVVIGANSEAGQFGAVYIFKANSGGGWTQEVPKLLGTGSVGGTPNQGWSVALNIAGTALVFGGIGDNNFIGAVWFFTWSGTYWQQQGAKITANDVDGIARFGYSVALNGNGDILAVGAFNDANSLGATWIFTRTDNLWTQQGAKIVGAQGVEPCYQGWSVALNQAGSTLAVGGIRDSDYKGAVWIFTSSNGNWTQQGPKLVGSGGADGANEQGGSVALSASGSVLVVGAPADNRNLGAVWVYTRTNGEWAQQGEKLIGTGDPGPSDIQGTSVSISGAGGILAFGGPYENSGEGGTWVFARNENNVWEQQGEKLVGSNGIGLPSQGYSVALANDGNTIVIGGNTDNMGKGASWVFKGPGVPSPSPTPPTPPPPTPSPTPPTPAPTPTPSPQPAETSGLTSGQKAVVAIIVIIALLLIAGVAYYYRKRQQQHSELGGPLAASDAGGAPGPASTTSFQSFQEAVDD